MNPLKDKSRHRQFWKAIGISFAILALCYYPYPSIGLVGAAISYYVWWLQEPKFFDGKPMPFRYWFECGPVAAVVIPAFAGSIVPLVIAAKEGINVFNPFNLPFLW